MAASVGLLIWQSDNDERVNQETLSSLSAHLLTGEYYVYFKHLAWKKFDFYYSISNKPQSLKKMCWTKKDVW